MYEGRADDYCYFTSNTFKWFQWTVQHFNQDQNNLTLVLF